MKLKYSFEPVEMGDEIIFVPVGEGAASLHCILRVNRTGQEIMNLLMSEASEESIVSILSKKYDNDQEELSGFVRNFLNTLRETNLINE